MTLQKALEDLQTELGRQIDVNQVVNHLNESASILLPQIEHCLPSSTVVVDLSGLSAPLPPDFWKARSLVRGDEPLIYYPPWLFVQKQNANRLIWTIDQNRLKVNRPVTDLLFTYLVKPAPFALTTETNWWLDDYLRWQTLKYLTLTRYLYDKDRWQLWTALFKNALDQLQRTCSSKKNTLIAGEEL